MIKNNYLLKTGLVRIAAMLTLALLIASASVCPAYAWVRSTANAAGGADVYIAGNPELYPAEYYDDETGEYRGILPEVYRRISEETGIDFLYIHSGKVNKQKYLIVNKQVDIVSALSKSGMNDTVKEFAVLEFESEGKKNRIYIGFTDIASEETVKAVTSSIKGMSDKELADIAVKVAYEGVRGNVPIFYLILPASLAVLALVLLILLILRRRKDNRRRINSYIDSVTGIGNEKYFRKCYEEAITPDSFGLYNIGYIAVDVQKTENYRGTHDSEALMRFAAGLITEFAGSGDFVACIGKGAFAIGFQAPSADKAKDWLEKLVFELNSYEEDSLSSYNICFRAGLYQISTSQVSEELAVSNAKLGYVYAETNNLPVEICDDDVIKIEALRSRLQRRLSDAIEKKEFKPYLQMMWDSRTDRFCGAEVLSRWLSPEEGLLTPGRYIEHMINAGLVRNLDMYIFEECCKFLDKWKDTELGDLALSCNLTRVTISDASFVKRFKDILEGYSFDRNKLILELTEDSLADSMTAAIRNIEFCKKEGFRLALDDFGSGYSSINDICDYPIDILKLDCKMIGKASTEKGLMLIRGIIALAHEMNIEVVCEGVETGEQRDIVESIGCDYIQGFYFSRVLPFDEAEIQLHKAVRDDFCL